MDSEAGLVEIISNLLNATKITSTYSRWYLFFSFLSLTKWIFNSVILTFHKFGDLILGSFLVSVDFCLWRIPFSVYKFRECYSAQYLHLGLMRFFIVFNWKCLASKQQRSCAARTKHYYYFIFNSYIVRIIIIFITTFYFAKV